MHSAPFNFVTRHTSDRWTDRIAKAIPCIALHAVTW